MLTNEETKIAADAARRYKKGMATSLFSHLQIVSLREAIGYLRLQPESLSYG